MNLDNTTKTKKISLKNTKGETVKNKVKFDIFGRIITPVTKIYVEKPKF